MPLVVSVHLQLKFIFIKLNRLLKSIFVVLVNAFSHKVYQLLISLYSAQGFLCYIFLQTQMSKRTVNESKMHLMCFQSLSLQGH